MGHFCDRRNGEEKAYIAIFTIWQGPLGAGNPGDKHHP
jgi:hypothetical protein